VVAELDERRRALLLETVQSVSQAVLTATDPGMFTAGFLQTAALLQVVGGRVTADDSTGNEAAAQEEAGEQVSSPS
jgi:recombinational DNA repair ATPase RecF